MRLTILLLPVAMSIPGDANAQLASPVGFIPHATELYVVGSPPSPSWRMPTDTTHGRPLWPWVVGGAIAGAVTGVAMGAAANAHTDDNFFPQLAIAYGLALGALGGAALGAVIGAIYNGATQ